MISCSGITVTEQSVVDMISPSVILPPCVIKPILMVIYDHNVNWQMKYSKVKELALIVYIIHVSMFWSAGSQ